MNTFNHIVGALEKGKPAYMHFYGAVNAYNTEKFNEEFLHLQNVIQPSKIVIYINSEGGSVIHGMSTYSLIQSSSIETETVIDGIAASMGSVIWAAGTRSYMRDYSILMIHNPFCKHDEDLDDEDHDKDDDKDKLQMLAAFQRQIETVYTKRFGLAREMVQNIMSGEEGCDGTWFDAKSAVKAGILPKENVIKTKKQVREKVKGQIDGVTDAKQLQEIMATVCAELEDFKPLTEDLSIPKQNQDKNIFNKTMNDNVQDLMLSSVVAQLGLGEKAGMADVVNTINDLMASRVQLNELQNSFNELKIQKEGLDANLNNVKNELTDVKAKLQAYIDAEQAQRDAEIVAFVDAAIADNKINNEAKDMWVEMAKSNFDMVKATLNSIEKPVKMSQKIAEDPANIRDAHDGLNEAERMMQAQMKELYSDFEFKTMGE